MADIESNENPLAKLGPQIAGGVIMLVLGIAALSRVGCQNHHTEAGHAGYIRSTPFVGAGGGGTTIELVEKSLLTVAMLPP